MKRYMFSLVVLLVAAVGVAQGAYTSGFEQNEQSPAFVLGGLKGQGTPAWGAGYYSGYDTGGGSVVNNNSSSGDQAMYLGGYDTAWINTGTYQVERYYSFDICTNFDMAADGDDPLYGDRFGFQTIRGAVGAGVVAAKKGGKQR